MKKFAIATAVAAFAAFAVPASAATLDDQIRGTMQAAGSDASGLSSIVAANPGNASAIAAAAVQVRPDLAGSIATVAAGNGGSVLGVAKAMSGACSACAFDISDALEAVAPGQATEIRAAVADGAASDDGVADSFVSIRVVTIMGTIEIESQDVASAFQP